MSGNNSALLISGLVVGGFGLLVLIIGAILMATAKDCNTADEACNGVKNRKKAGIGMVVMGCVLGVIGAVLLILKYRGKTISSNVTSPIHDPVPSNYEFPSVPEPKEANKLRAAFKDTYNLSPKEKKECFPLCINYPCDNTLLGACNIRADCNRDCSKLFS